MNIRVEQLKEALKELDVRREAINAQIIELTYTEKYEDLQKKEEQRIKDMQARIAELAAQKKVAEREKQLTADRKAAAKRIKDLETALAQAEADAEEQWKKDNADFMQLAEDDAKEVGVELPADEPEAQEEEKEEE